MSHFTRIRTKLLDRDTLVQVLREFGFAQVEVHSEPQILYGYEGDPRPERAEIIIRRQFIGEFSNDLGFQLQPDGSYSAIISDYDRGKYNQEWLDKLTQRYTHLRLLHTAQSQGLQVACQEILGDGTIRIVLQ
jgi:hypothetical protein